MTGGHTDMVYFMRVGTLDEPKHLPPDAHIYTTTKQPWVVLPSGALAVEEFYDIEKTWSADSLSRLDVLRDRLNALDS